MSGEGHTTLEIFLYVLIEELLLCVVTVVQKDCEDRIQCDRSLMTCKEIYKRLYICESSQSCISAVLKNSRDKHVFPLRRQEL